MRGYPLLGTVSRLGLSLLPARAAQAVTGAGSVWAIGRAVDLGGLGEVLTTVAAVGIVTGVVTAALSDFAVATPGGTAIRFPSVVRWSAYAAGVATIAAEVGAAPTFWIVSFFLVASLSAALEGALRLARARAESKTARIGLAWTAAGLVSVAGHIALSLLGVESWTAYLVAYLPTMMSPLLLPKLTPVRPQQRWEAPTLRSGASELLAYAVTQGSWLVIAQAPIIMGRILLSPEAAGILGVVIRITDAVAVLLPMMGLMTMPLFAETARVRGRLEQHRRLNDRLALLGSTWLLAVGPLGWILWQVLVPGAPFPRLVYLVVLAGDLVGAAFGVPDRMLQVTGRARSVGRWGAIAAAASLLWAAVFGTAAGLHGVASARVAAAVTANLALTHSIYRAARRLLPYLLTAVVTTGIATVGLLLLPGRLLASSLWALLFGLGFVWIVVTSRLPEGRTDVVDERCAGSSAPTHGSQELDVKDRFSRSRHPR
jgi:O-antigen/teichoic acid export membrane protein